MDRNFEVIRVDATKFVEATRPKEGGAMERVVFRPRALVSDWQSGKKEVALERVGGHRGDLIFVGTSVLSDGGKVGEWNFPVLSPANKDIK